MFKGLIAAAIALGGWVPAHANIGSLPTAPVEIPKTSGAFSIGDQYGLSPYWDWKSIETPHFRLTFPAELDETARKAADYCEEAYALLTTRFKWQPTLRTSILILDNADAANGLTAAVQHFGIILYTTPPDNFFSTAYYDDWLRLLVLHEYTHFVNMDTTTGIWAGFRIVIGDVLLPNSFWPTWMLEGLAVYMETRLTRSGRGKSPYYEMLLRTAIEAGTLGVSSSNPDYTPLDRVNGTNPYYPGGETAYFYGYQLMNEVSLSAGDTATGENALGEMSKRSGHRIPYFINGNLTNITGRDWYAYWDSFIERSRKRMEPDLAKIRTQPLTRTEKLVEVPYGVQGTAASPDGRWLAYSLSSTERRQGLYLMDLKAGTTRRLSDKMLGIGISFTPDSRFLLHSTLGRHGQYRVLTDLVAYDIERDREIRLSEGLRARDPNVSRDGRTVVFTVAANAGVGISTAPLLIEDHQLKLGDVTVVQEPSHLDRASNPVFTTDGKSVVFSFHKNGETQEDLLFADLASGKISTLVRNGRFNRWPAIDPVTNKVFFVSDLTGVDNLFRIDPAGPAQVTNVTTGVWMPTFGPAEGAVAPLYASLFTIHGWDLARIYPEENAISSRAVTVSEPSAPVSILDEAPSSLPGTSSALAPKVEELYSATEAEAKNYSVWPSILPRQWLPLAYLVPGGAYLGGQVFGFDTLDLHRYLLAGAWDTTTRRGDWLALYWNRSLGPTLSLSGSNLTRSTEYFATQLLSFERKIDFSASISYPFRGTYSAITPALSLNAERTFYFEPARGLAALAQTSYVPSVDFTLNYSNAQSSRLAISTERGRFLKTGVRTYIDSGSQYHKGIASWTEHLPLGGHAVLVPQVKGAAISRRNRANIAENVVLRGKTYRLVDTLDGDDFDDLGIRGYGGRNFLARSAVVPSLDFRFPIARLFRGAGTLPAFGRDLHGFVFAEAAWLPGAVIVHTLPSAGGGLIFDTELFLRLPLEFAVEYHHSFRKQFAFKADEILVSLSLGALSF